MSKNYCQGLVSTIPDNFFSTFVGKNAIFPTLIRGDRGYVIQLKCPNYTFGWDCSFRWSKSNAPLLVQHFLKGLDWALFRMIRNLFIA